MQSLSQKMCSILTLFCIQDEIITMLKEFVLYHALFYCSQAAASSDISSFAQVRLASVNP